MDQKIFEIDGKNALIGTRECMVLNLANRQRDTVSDVFIEGMVGDSHIKVMGVVVVPFRGKKRSIGTSEVFSLKLYTVAACAVPFWA